MSFNISYTVKQYSLSRVSTIIIMPLQTIYKSLMSNLTLYCSFNFKSLNIEPLITMKTTANHLLISVYMITKYYRALCSGFLLSHVSIRHNLNLILTIFFFFYFTKKYILYTHTYENPLTNKTPLNQILNHLQDP